MPLYQTMQAECRRLHLLSRVRLSDDEFVLNERFHRSMYDSLRPTTMNDAEEAAVDPNPPLIQKLVENAEQCWEIVNHASFSKHISYRCLAAALYGGIRTICAAFKTGQKPA
jgi:hypothetical protein